MYYVVSCGAYHAVENENQDVVVECETEDEAEEACERLNGAGDAADPRPTP